jgi:hypothetical protein
MVNTKCFRICVLIVIMKHINEQMNNSRSIIAKCIPGK